MRALASLLFIRCLFIAIVRFRFRSTQYLNLFEVGGVVAALAIASEFTVVFVVAGVTAVAILRQLCRFAGAAMAIVALQFGMRAAQRKLRLRVIEFPLPPTAAVVASLAARAKRAFMFIDRLVATHALLGRAFERAADMTTFAGHHRVHAGQWKLGLLMIKGELGFPTGLVVAFLALLALLTFVCIVELVATETIFRQRIVQITAMATGTGDIAMFAVQ